MCIHEGCKTRPNFNKPGEKAIYCSSHKKEGMVDVNHNACIHQGCKTIPYFNKIGEKAIYCFLHKLNGMVNVQKNICIHPQCRKRPNFNKPGEKAIYCASHKKEGMVDVISCTCIHENCKKRPLFNKKGEKAIYCASHKKEDMVDVKHKTCIHENCKTIPLFNKKGETAIYCASHKKEDMINVVSKTCKSEWCSTRVHEKYDGYCLYCYMNLFPDKPVTRNYKTKEYSVVNYVKTNYPQPWIADKITGGCSRRRPDLLLDLMDQVIIVEVDENQHIEYDCSCENKRMMELSQDLAHRSIVFIRFNPDEYQTNGTKIASCWGKNKNGICVVKKTKKDEWNQRLHALGETIEYWLNHRTEKTVEIIQLFYDIL